MSTTFESSAARKSRLRRERQAEWDLENEARIRAEEEQQREFYAARDALIARIGESAVCALEDYLDQREIAKRSDKP